IGSQDQASENVLSSASPAYIVIGGSADITPTNGSGPTNTPVPIPTSIPTATPDVTATPGPSTIVTDTPGPTNGLTGTRSPTGTGGGNQPPVCNNLASDRETTGTALFSITDTANGTDSDGTISKVTFNFGDGQVNDVTQAGSIGSNSVNVQIAHTYNTDGSYQ